MNTLWQALLANLALVSILVVLWDFVGEWTARLSTTLQAVLLGLIFGGGAIVSMATAAIVFGFVFDLRAPLLGAAALFGGGPGAIVAGIGALFYRIHLGGVGVMAGIVDISITCAIGLAGFRLKRHSRQGIAALAIFSLAIALGRLPAYLLVPAHLRWPLLVSTGPAIVTVTFAGSLLIAVVLRWQARRRDLSLENAVFRAMVRELPDCLNVKDFNGRFVAANPATAAFMGAESVADLIGKTDFDFFPKDIATQYLTDDQEMLRNGTLRRVDQRAIFPDGRDGWLSSLKAPLHDENGRLAGIITYNRDVTEIKRVAEAKSEFIATVSHELRTPLTSIRGSLGLLAGGVAGQLPAKAENLIKIAYANSERLVLLVNDILDIERIEADRMPFDMQPMVLGPCLEQAIAASANYQPERSITIALVNEAPDAVAQIDPGRLQQVMANLLSNAMKFSHVGGVVEVGLTRLRPGVVRISVSDHGTGIPESFRKRIFGKFEQADASNTREKGGTGLGLNIVKAIVERLGGTIDFRSALADGTTFFVDLPECTAEGGVVAGAVKPLAKGQAL